MLPKCGVATSDVESAYLRIIDDTIRRSRSLQSTAVLEQLRQKWIEQTHERLLRGSHETSFFQGAATAPHYPLSSVPIKTDGDISIKTEVKMEGEICVNQEDRRELEDPVRRVRPLPPSNIQENPKRARLPLSIGSHTAPSSSRSVIKLKLASSSSAPAEEAEKANPSETNNKIDDNDDHDDDGWGDASWEDIKSVPPQTVPAEIVPSSHSCSPTSIATSKNFNLDDACEEENSDMQGPGESGIDVGEDEHYSDLDDVSSLDDEEPEDCAGLIIGQFETVQRPQSRKTHKGLWRLKLRHGIIQLGGREVLFNTLTGDVPF